MSLRVVVTFVGFGIFSVAWAHEGVKNPAVMARMEGMKVIGDETKRLGLMARGQEEFDATQVLIAARSIEVEAEQAITLFEAEEMDPKSEARPAIWTNFDDFRAKSKAMAMAARSIQAVNSVDELRAEMPRLAETCGACHEAYRIKK